MCVICLTLYVHFVESFLWSSYQSKVLVKIYEVCTPHEMIFHCGNELSSNLRRLKNSREMLNSRLGLDSDRFKGQRRGLDESFVITLNLKLTSIYSFSAMVTKSSRSSGFIMYSLTKE